MCRECGRKTNKYHPDTFGCGGDKTKAHDWRRTAGGVS